MDWTRGRPIGSGSTATVSIARAHDSGQVFAVKSAELSKSEFLQREQRILSKLGCAQIVAYRGFDVSSENGKLLYNLFLEYAPGGTISDVIHQHYLEEAVIRSYTQAMLVGLHYLHSNGIVHCDIKGQNVLVTSEGVKLADLGCARWVGDDPSCPDQAPMAGTPVYMAPEVARGEQQGFPADVWALGCTVIEMATGRPPWTDVSGAVSAIYRIGFSNDVPETPSFLSEEAKDFLGKCLRRDPKERWSAAELLKHEFVNQPTSLLKKINTYSNPHESDTPTGILDFWDSVEELETTYNTAPETTDTSAMERIKKLTQGNSSSIFPTWSSDETWTTVRSNDINDPQTIRSCNFSAASEPPSICHGKKTCRNSKEYQLVIPNEKTTVNREMDTSINNISRHQKGYFMGQWHVNVLKMFFTEMLMVSIQSPVCHIPPGSFPVFIVHHHQIYADFNRPNSPTGSFGC